MTANSARTAAGRPRDPAVDDRVHVAAIAVYAEVGWAGFTIDTVARRAAVGKASIYLRWPDKYLLLIDSLKAQLPRIDHVDTGTVRGDLVELADQLVRTYLTPAGRAFHRLRSDAADIPGLRERFEQYRRGQIAAARAIVRRGIARGQLAPATSVTILMECLGGAAMVHVLSTPDELRPRVERNARAYCEELVDFLLDAVAAREPHLVDHRD